jgi:uncharacterized protein YjeT (DUF2065 family)
MIPALLIALGLVFVIEGLLYALVPRQLKTMMQAMESLPEETLRTGGLVAIGIGVFLVWLVRTVVGA